MEKQTDRLQRIFREHGGILRTKQALALGIHPRDLYKQRDLGQIVQISRGLFVLPDADVANEHSFAIVARKVPQGVLCLLSALQFHNLTTQHPFEVWIALERTARAPKDIGIPIRFSHFSRESFSTGVETHLIDGVPVRVYSVAKTIADCFKYRNKVGLDVALEAFKEGWHQKRFTMNELSKYAQICRVNRVMLPYLEGMVA
ncbi:MAG: type IV toxin-antitoxin system AbiEi family antitoxin domain-containing protein [Fimbriimonadia bacterium]|nr:type IV toxin-antitoxin system AbiEi family antitoxin domain-containing protein [Fimbriimonadia bacterium]